MRMANVLEEQEEEEEENEAVLSHPGCLDYWSGSVAYLRLPVASTACISTDWKN